MDKYVLGRAIEEAGGFIALGMPEDADQVLQSLPVLEKEGVQMQLGIIEGGPISFRAASEADKDLPVKWSGRANALAFNKALLPPLGCVVEDKDGPCAAAWVYLSCNIGIAFLGPVVTRPDLNKASTDRAMRYALTALGKVTRNLDYGVLVAYTTAKFATELRALGWLDGDHEPHVAMFRKLGDSTVPDTQG